MNYARIYEDFIADRRSRDSYVGLSYQQRHNRDSRDRRRGIKVPYREHHHIIPRSLNGGDEAENIVSLAAGDHFFAHLCLAKIHGGNQWLALHTMTYGAEQHCGRVELISKRRWFETIREKSREAIAANTRLQHKDPAYLAALHSEEANAKRAATMRAHFASEAGRDHKEARIAALKTPEFAEKQREIMLARQASGELDDHNAFLGEMARQQASDPKWLASLPRGKDHARVKNPEKWANAVEKMKGNGNPMKDPRIVERAMKNRRNGYKNNRERAVLCVETGVVYESISAAIKETNGSRKISDVCLGKRKTSGGFHWEYAS